MAHYVGKVSEHALLFNDEGKLLLLRHKGPWPDLEGKWHLPGGRLETDDQPGLSLLREIEEETGLNGVELILPCHATRWGGEEPIKYSVCYLARIRGKAEVKLPPEENHDAAEWVTLEDAATRDYIYPPIRDVVNEAGQWARKLGMV